MPAILALVAQIIALVPTLVSAGIDVADLIANARKVIDENRVPSDPEWDALDAAVTSLQQQFRAASA